MVKKLLSNFALLLAMMVAGAGSAWADTTYKLEKVTQVSAGKLYVFEQDGYVMNNTLANSALQTTNTYNTKGLTGGETYVWTLEASNSNFKMVNVYNKANDQSNLLANPSSTTISFNGTGSDWAFNFQSDGTVLIQNTKNSNRFLGFASASNRSYKAYATNNLTSYPHAINVYQLVEEGPADERQEATLNFSSEEVRIALNAAEGDYELPTLNNPANLSVTYSSSNDDIITEVGGAFIVATEAVGEATMTATFAGNDTYKPATAEFKVVIYDPNVKGTMNNPFTVAEAIEAINTSYDANTTYFVKGIISQIDSYNDKYGSITYWISDDGTTTNQFECYGGLNIGGAEFESVDDLSTGDQVVVKGKLKKYGNIYEFDKNNEIVSRIADQRIDIATINSISIETVAPGESGTITYDIDFAEGTAESDYNVTLTSNNTTLLQLTGFNYVAGNEEGEVTITVNVEPTNGAIYKAVRKTFTVTIYDANKKGSENNPYTVAEVIAKAPQSTTVIEADVFVKGYIIGSCNTSSGDLLEDDVDTNMAIADSPTDTENYITVALPSGTVRDNFNVVSKPYNVGVAQVLMKGDIAKYCGRTGIKNTEAVSKKVAEQVSITSAGMATYYTDCALDFTDFTDMYAYTATVSGNTITFSRVMQVPTNTGVLLRNPAGVAASNVVPVATGTVDPVEGNKFVGTLTDITVSTAGCYILNNGSEGLGFYKVKSTGSKVAAHRAYLKTGDGVRSFIGFSEGDANGIESVGAEAGQSMEVYNLQGVRVAQPTKGLYIMNGKKVIFK